MNTPLVGNDDLRNETALESGRFVMIARGSGDEAIKVREMINRTKPESKEQLQPASAAILPRTVSASFLDYK